MRKILLMLVIFSVLLGNTYAQSRRITGKVTSTEDGSPLPGVNVIVKGTSGGTSTNSDGSYALEVAGSASVSRFAQSFPLFAGYNSTLLISLIPHY